jgi:hypothetical protein
MDKMAQRPTVIQYRNYRYLKAASLLVSIAIVAYAFNRPAGGESHGGTRLGYVLGVISTLIVFMHMWYGVRKRCTPKAPDRRQFHTRRKQEDGGAQADAYARRKMQRREHPADESWRHGGTLQGWLSAHIYLGASLIVLVSLHAGFQFGWNVHTLPYALMLLVIASGSYGTFAYLNYPRLITENMGEDTLNGVLLKIAGLDELARVRALDLPDEVNAVIFKARKDTRLGGNFFQQLCGSPRDCPSEWALQQVQDLSKQLIKDDQPELMRDLYSVLLHKHTLVLRARNEIMLKARMQAWLYLHVPLSIALLAALFAHILAIFFYW